MRPFGDESEEVTKRNLVFGGAPACQSIFCDEPEEAPKRQRKAVARPGPSKQKQQSA